MNVKLLIGTLLIYGISGCVPTTPKSPPTNELELVKLNAPAALSNESTYLTARKRVHERVTAQTRLRKARNVILFIGDGMGVSTVTAARILQGQQAGQSGEENYLSFERFPYSAFSKTYNSDLQVPDSAGTMSAMMTGMKARGGTISIRPENPRGNCAGAVANRAETFLELAETQGQATGVISTARITHATPAATYAHSADRNWEVDAAMPEIAREQGCQDIASQLVNFSYGDGIEILLGGGRRFFLSNEATDPENEDETGGRVDGRNLVTEWQKKNPDGVFMWNEEQFQRFDTKRRQHVLGLFEGSHMAFEVDRELDSGREPSLTEMTRKAIENLQGYAGGYFLMVEGGRIDHAHHGGNAYRALTEAIEFSEAVAAADDMTSDEDTLIIVTADHSHTMTINGYPRRGNPILGKVIGPDGKMILGVDGLPYTTLTYADGPGYVKDRPDLSEVDTEAPNYLQQAAFPLESETHGGEDVAVYAKGPGEDLMRGVIEQNEIFHIMLEASIIGSDVPKP